MAWLFKNTLSVVLTMALLLIELVFLFAFGCIIYFHFIYPRLIKTIPDRIINSTNVKEASVFEEDLSELQITIVFNNGGQIELWNTNEHLKGDIAIKRFNKYGFYIFSRKGLYRSSINLNLLNCLLDKNIKTIFDIIENYDAISSLIRSWPNVSELRESKDETIKQIIEKKQVSLPSVILNGEEVFFALINYHSGERGR